MSPLATTVRRIPRVRAVSLAICLAVAGAAPTAAQEAAPGARQETRSIVRFLVRGRIVVPRGELASLPPLLTTAVAAQGSLAVVTVDASTGREGTAVVEVGFAFEGEEEFRRWYADPRTRSLLRDLQTALVEPSYRYDVKRFPSSRWFTP